MASYFYLMSSLPMLKAEGEMPFSYEQFLNYCSGNVSEESYDLLKNLTVESNKGPLIEEWSYFYAAYKGELTFQRNKRMNRPAAQPFLKDPEATRIIASAMADPNPLNAEKTLLSLQFERLDSLIGIHAYDEQALFGYALKLKLLERKTVFDQKKGKAELDRLVKGLEEQIQSIN